MILSVTESLKICFKHPHHFFSTFANGAKTSLLFVSFPKLNYVMNQVTWEWSYGYLNPIQMIWRVSLCKGKKKKKDQSKIFCKIVLFWNNSVYLCIVGMLFSEKGWICKANSSASVVSSHDVIRSLVTLAVLLKASLQHGKLQRTSYSHIKQTKLRLQGWEENSLHVGPKAQKAVFITVGGKRRRHLRDVYISLVMLAHSLSLWISYTWWPHYKDTGQHQNSDPNQSLTSNASKAGLGPVRTAGVQK